MKQILVFALACLYVNLAASQNRFVCPTAGKFADRNSWDCTNFFVCIMKRGRLTAVTVSCPERMVFDWDDKACVPERFYTCPNQDVRPPLGFVCPDQGNYPNELSVDCSVYYYCHGAGFSPMEISCSPRTTFNWKLGKCDRNELVGCAASAPEFVCPGVGDWLNHNSHACESYMQCFRHYDGTIRHNLAFCPAGQSFDFIRRRCRPTLVAACPKQL
jgi:Chitin binding Peritrophin-A domain